MPEFVNMVQLASRSVFVNQLGVVFIQPWILTQQRSQASPSSTVKVKHTVWLILASNCR